MARGAQFLELVIRVRAETGRSTNVSVGVDDVEGLKSMINRTYSLLWAQYTWPHLRQEFTKTLSPGQRYYDLPTGLDLERLERVSLLYNGLSYGVDRGIDFVDYDVWNPANNERSDPALKWDVRYIPDAGKDQIEVWPLPATQQQLRFYGTLRFAPLVEDADICKLDDDLVILFTVARILKRQKDADAEDALSAANNHLRKLRIRMQADDKPCLLGVGQSDYRTQPTRAVVRIAGA